MAAVLTGAKLFGVRHHSPRCSAVLERWLEREKPACVLIEGPSDASHLIEILAENGTQPPVAILAYRKDGTPGSSLWPFAAYSPEYTAARWAVKHRIPVEFIDIPAGVVLPKPLHILHVSTRDEALANTRSLVGLGANAEAKLIETFAGTAGKSYLTAAVTEIRLGDNAGLDHYKVQVESDKAYHFGGVYVSQEKTSRFKQSNLSFGGLLARNEIHAELGTGSECELNGLFLAKGRQHVDNHTLIHHLEPYGTSRETYRGVLAERARGVFQGRIVVHPQAQKTNAEMNNRNLLLSEDAEIDAKPQLEILADDVKCSHGVAVGQLDPESVFYLVSRGVDSETARNMLTFAFANEMVEKIGLDSLRAKVQGHLLDLFPQTGIRRDWL
ncbi:FeS cluster assembly protein SufD [uncultured bacterium]|nr:FeS cluster assembly protein SufD [uncultured bacterium]